MFRTEVMMENLSIGMSSKVVLINEVAPSEIKQTNNLMDRGFECLRIKFY